MSTTGAPTSIGPTACVAWRATPLGAAIWKAARFRTAAELRALAEQAGLSVMALRGAVYYPPADLLTRVLTPIDPLLGGLTTFGAAFIALSAVSAGDHRKERSCR